MTNINEQFIPIVLCAGLGSRLAPLTHFLPKVVCPIIDKPIAFYNIEQLFLAGFEYVHCNTHYLSQTVCTELKEAAAYSGYDPKRIVFWHEKDLLETGGGIARIYNEMAKQESANETKDLLVVSGDIVAKFPINRMTEIWKNKSPHDVGLMGTRTLHTARKDVTWVSEDFSHVVGFGDQRDKAQNYPSRSVARLFSNHQIISHTLVRNCPIEKKSSVALFYKPALESNKNILHFPIEDSEYWFNVGTAQEYEECVQHVLSFRNGPRAQKENKWSVNMAHCMPESLKKELFKNTKRVEKIPQKNAIVIAFKDSEQKKGVCVPVRSLVESVYDPNREDDFYFQI